MAGDNGRAELRYAPGRFGVDERTLIVTGNAQREDVNCARSLLARHIVVVLVEFYGLKVDVPESTSRQALAFAM